MPKKSRGCCRAGDEGACEPRIEVIVKMQKSRGEGQGGCEPKIKFFVKMKKKDGGGGEP